LEAIKYLNSANRSDVASGLQQRTLHKAVATALTIREARNAAASAARKADVVIVSVLGRTELPSAVRAWFDMWLWLLEDENPALVALFDSSVPANVASICTYLNSMAPDCPETGGTCKR